MCHRRPERLDAAEAGSSREPAHGGNDICAGGVLRIFAALRVSRRRQAVVIGTCSPVLCVTAVMLNATAAQLDKDDAPVLWTSAVGPLLVLIPLYWVGIRVHHQGE